MVHVDSSACSVHNYAHTPHNHNTNTITPKNHLPSPKGIGMLKLIPVWDLQVFLPRFIWNILKHRHWPFTVRENMYYPGILWKLYKEQKLYPFSVGKNSIENDLRKFFGPVKNSTILTSQLYWIYTNNSRLLQIVVR